MTFPQRPAGSEPTTVNREGAGRRPRATTALDGVAGPAARQLLRPAPTLAAIRRQQQILDLLRQRDFVTLADIRAANGGSAATIHRDLTALAAAGDLIRVRGGAVRPSARVGGVRQV